MKNKTIDKMTNDELKSKINLIKKDLFNIRFKRTSNQLTDTSKISLLKKDMAKLLTKMNRKKKHE